MTKIMGAAVLLLFAGLFASCNHLPTSPVVDNGLIVANVHFGNQGVPGISVQILQTGDSATTGQNGLATFSVPPGQYTVRAFGINRGGPAYMYVDFAVTANRGEVAIVDIFDCLLCL